MRNKKNNKNVKRTTPNRVSGQRSSGGPKTTSSQPKMQLAKPRRAPTMKMVEQVCGVNDPFCPAAQGSKYADLGKVRSFPYQFHGRTTVGTDANGSASMLFLPTYYNLPYLVPSGAIVGDTVTLATAVAATVTILPASYRLVSFGYIVRSIVAPLSASGMVRIRNFDASSGSYFAAYPMSAYNCSSYADVPLNNAKEVAVVLNRTDERAKHYKVALADGASGGNVTTLSGLGFSTSALSITGGPASVAVLDVEWFANYEITFPDGDAMAMACTQPPPLEPIVSQATDRVSSVMQSIFQSGVKAVGNFAMREAKLALTAFMV